MVQATSRLALFAALPLLAAQPLQAQSAPETVELDEVVVSATRTAMPISRTGSATSVLTAADLEKSGDTQIAHALSRLPGVSLVQNGPLGTATRLRIRGTEPRHTALYIDGVRVDDTSGIATEFDFGTLTSLDIGRAELLRGSQSALWGSSAIGGVLNLTSRRAEKMGFSQDVALEAGSYGTAKARYSFGHRSERAEISVNLSQLRSKGFSAVDTLPRNPNSERDGFRASRISLSGRVQLTDELSIGASGFAQSSYSEYDGWGADALGNFDKRREAGGRLFAEYQLGTTRHELSATRYRVSRDIYGSGVQTDRYVGLRSGFAYQGTTEVSPALTLVYGADTTKEEAETRSWSKRQGSRVSGVFAQGIWTPREGLDVTLALRQDRNSDFGSQPNGRLALAWQASDALVLRAALATGYLSPPLSQRFGTPAFGIAPNPDLTPEKSRSFEIGADYSFASGASLGVTAFRITTDNAIDYCGLPGDPWSTPCVGSIPGGFDNMYENRPGETRRKGIEISGRAPIGSRLEATLAYAYIDAKGPSGSRVANVPRHNATLGLEAQVTDAFSASVSLQGLGGRTGNMPGFGVLNAGIGYQLTADTAVSLRAENLFDKGYQLVNGYATPGRSFYLGLKHSF